MSNSPLVAALTELFSSRAPKQELLRGTLGDGNGNVLYAPLNDYVYVRLRGSTKSVVTAFNLQVPNLNDLAVDVLRITDHSQILYTVLGRTQGYNLPRGATSIANVVMHGTTHLPYGYDAIPLAFHQVAVATAYTVLSTDDYIAVSTGVAAAIALPDVTTLPNGRAFLIHDSTGTAGANNITISAFTGQLIEGAATYVINTNKGSALLITDGKSWTVPVHL